MTEEFQRSNFSNQVVSILKNSTGICWKQKKMPKFVAKFSRLQNKTHFNNQGVYLPQSNLPCKPLHSRWNYWAEIQRSKTASQFPVRV